MAGLTTAEAQATLDQRFPTTGGSDYIGWSVNGTSEFPGVARTAIGATGWDAATSADPSVKANGAALESAGCTVTGPSVVGYWAVFSAPSGGNQRTDWTAVDSSRTLGLNDTIKAAAGALRVTLT